MKVLCAQRDVLGKIGGGESAATRLFARATDAVFTWPVSRPPVSTLAPNFDHVVVDAGFQSTVREQLRPLDDSPLRNDCADFYEAMSIAHAVRGREFDIVECADYLPYGRFLPFAFSEVGVKYGRLVCSLHGRVSRTLEIENEFNRVISSSRLDALKAAEQQFIFGSADVRYGFSERYVRQAMSAVPLSAEIIDPLCALPSLRITQHDSGRNATVWFVGRQERIKGGDLFLRAIFRAGPELWQRYAMCGPAARLGNRPAVIEGMSFCRNRGMPFRYRGSLSYANVVREVYETGALVVIPSREDTFNLVALEALLNGVPVLISKYAGAADFIRARFGSDFLGAQEFDPYDELTAAATMRTMLRQLDEHRIAVRGALDHTDLTPQPDRLMHVYTARAQHDRSLRDDASRAWERVRTVVAGFGPRPSAPREERGLKPATTQENLFVNRARKYRELAVSEATSRPVVAAAYRLRGFRMQALSPNEVSALAQDLHDLRFREEEASLRLWSSDAQITGYLEQRRQRLSRVDITPAEYIVDRRDTAVPKVSIVVSIYNATKPILEHFIAQLGAVSMVRNRRAEVLFVDSGSTVPQRDLLEAIPGFHQISHLLVRSVERETIQSAWNRGIQFCRGEYMTCLGVDEGLTESALDELAKFLDDHQDIDWVTSNTVVTEVDERGNWKRDVLSYNRQPYSRFSYLNDCTYVNYVGGLYRRSIHDRFGWYDGTFKGAGDTEFKCRVFPFIRTAALPATLGFYFDFPAERVTNSAHVEIEDMRAWYVFRTPGGLEYLMRNEGVEGWEELFWSALAGRRCWAKASADCDLSLAANVLAGLLKREPSHPLRALSRRLNSILREMRLLQDWKGRQWLGTIAELDLIERSHSFFRKCGKLRPDLAFPLDYRGDAFFFAHSWTWQ